jgi:dolichol kinase
VGAYLWVKLFDVLASNDVLERKLSRKLIHTSCGPFFVLLWPLFSASPSAKYFAAAVPVLQGIRLMAIGVGAIENEDAIRAVSREGDRTELLRGPLYYTAVLVVCTAVFWRGSPSGIAALSLMCGGDGLADIVGRRLGKGNPLPFNADKSYAGSAAMFLGGFGLSLALCAFFHALGYMSVDPGSAAGRLALIAAACTAIEALPAGSFLDDNISVPVVAVVLGGVLFQ